MTVHARILSGLLMVLMLLGVASPTWAAAASPGAGTTVSTQLPAVDPDAWSPERDPTKLHVGPSPYLSLTRWQSGSGDFHSRFDQFLMNDPVAMASRDLIQSLGMMGGNIHYTAAHGLLSLGLTMQPLDALGAQADHAAATVGRAMYENSGLVAAIVVVVIGGALFSFVRATGPKPWRKILATGLLVASLVVMTVGATQSDTVNGKFEPGLLSPGWIATKINSSVTTIASVPANALAMESPADAIGAAPGTECARYMENMADRFALDGHTGGSISQIMSRLWETSGLTVWKHTQFGITPYDGVATYGDHVFCHLLDWQSGVPVQNQMFMTLGTINEQRAANANPKSAAWGSPDNDQRDRSLIAWAACEHTGGGEFQVRDEWRQKSDGSTWIRPGDCQAWWTGDGDTDLSAFNISGAAADIIKMTESESIRDFVLTMHGNTASAGGMMLIWTYGVSALLTMLVFGGIGLAVMVAKFAAVVMIFVLFFVIIAALATGDTGNSKIGRFLQMYLGFSVFAFGAVFILAVITMLARMLSNLGQEVFGHGELISIIWTGFSPLIACVVLHMIFTKVFKLPSVFKPSHAMAWGAAAGGVGGVLGSQWVNRRESRARNAVARAGHTATNALKSKVMGRGAVGQSPRGSRRGAMAPAGAPIGAGAGTAAAAAGLGAGATSRQTVRDAKLFAKGIDPEDPNARLINTARNLRHTRETVKAKFASAKESLAAGRARLAQVTSEEGRQALRDRGREVGEFIRTEPGLTAALLTERAGKSMREAVRTGARRVAAPLQDPRSQAALGTSAKVLGGAIIGTAVAGPVGTAVGAAIGARGTRRRFQGASQQRNAQVVANYAAHMEEKAAQKVAEDKAAAAAAAGSKPSTRKANTAGDGPKR